MKKVLSIILAFSFIFSVLLTGCSKPTPTSIPDSSSLSNELVQYFNTTDFKNENYIASPLSFKVAMSMVAIGADGDTQKQLLDFLDFSSVEECIEWVSVINQDIFESKRKESTLLTANALWKNTTFAGDDNFLPEFKKEIKKTFNGDTYEFPSDELVNEVNAWSNKNTKGLIPVILKTPPTGPFLLTNSVYMKSPWEKNFSNESFEDYFTDINGNKQLRKFMSNTDSYKYYKDDASQMVVLPFKEGLSIALVLGDTNNLEEKLEKAQEKEVYVSMPIFEIETSLNNNELIDFAKSQNVTFPFDGELANFKKMVTTNTTNHYVGSISQTSKIIINAEGGEAASVTVVVMDKNDVAPMTEIPESFIANKPFSFFVLAEGKVSSEILFCGQMVK